MDGIGYLKKVKERLANKRDWCKDDLALNHNYDSVQPEDDDACCWCLVGALDYVMYCESVNRETRLSVSSHMEQTLEGLEIEDSHGDILYEVAMFNDEPMVTHSDVLDFLDKCIVDLESAS